MGTRNIERKWRGFFFRELVIQQGKHKKGSKKHESGGQETQTGKPKIRERET